MHALRGLTALTVAALTVILTHTAAVAADPDDGPTAAAAPGVGVTYVDWPATYQEYVGEWTGANALTLPRDVGTVNLVLSEELAALPFSYADVTIDVVGSSTLQVAAWADDFVSDRASFGLWGLLEQARLRGVTDITSLEIGIARTEDDVVLDLQLELDLVDGAPASVDIPLDDPPVRTSSAAFTGSNARVAQGGRINVVAWPGFFGTDAPQPVRVFHLQKWGDPVEVSGPISVSADGSMLTVPVPQGYVSVEYSDLEIRLGDPTGPEQRRIVFGLRPASTEAIEAYVTAVYNDLFGRDPDPNGLGTWTYQLSIGTPYTAVADAITSSTEFRSGLIRDAYAQYLGRLPDPSGLAFWLEQMRRGMHIQEMEAGFLASLEYYAYAGGTDAGWVRWLYLDVLGREPAPSEVSFWVPIVRSHGRGEVAKGFLYSTERLTTDVDGYYQWLLRRHLDPVGRTNWVRAIQAGTRVERIIAGIVASAEYRNNVPVG